MGLNETASSAETVGCFRFGQIADCVILSPSTVPREVGVPILTLAL